MKSKILILTVVLSIGCLIIAVKASYTVQQNQEIVERERYQRMVTEETLQKTLMQVKSLKNQLIGVRNQVQSLQTVLEKEKDASANVRSELEKVIKLKDVLERELKDALVN